MGRSPWNPGSWCRPRLPPQAGLGCFGWLPPACQPVTWWGKYCEAALAVAAKNCEKRHVEDWGTKRAGGGVERTVAGRGEPAPSAPLHARQEIPVISYSLLTELRALGAQGCHHRVRTLQLGLFWPLWLQAEP